MGDYSWIGGILEGAFGAATAITTTVVNGKTQQATIQPLAEPLQKSIQVVECFFYTLKSIYHIHNYSAHHSQNRTYSTLLLLMGLLCHMNL